MSGLLRLSRRLPRLLPLALVAGLLALNVPSASTASAQETPSITVILTEY
jgi:hypothetical protein